MHWTQLEEDGEAHAVVLKKGEQAKTACGKSVPSPHAHSAPTNPCSECKAAYDGVVA